MSKMTVEEAADNCDASDHWSKPSFIHGAEWQKQQMMDEASKGFEEYFKSLNIYSGPGFEMDKYTRKEAWQAAKISSMAEIEELKKEFNKYFKAFHVELNHKNELVAKVAELKEALKWALDILELNDSNLGIVDDYRKKFGLEDK